MPCIKSDFWHVNLKIVKKLENVVPALSAAREKLAKQYHEKFDRLICRYSQEPQMPDLVEPDLDSAWTWVGRKKLRKEAEIMNQEIMEEYQLAVQDYERRKAHNRKMLPDDLAEEDKRWCWLYNYMMRCENRVREDLKHLCSLGIINRRYFFDMEALIFIQDCLEIGWSDSLTGYNGAYYMYEQRRQHKETIGELEDLKKIALKVKENQEKQIELAERICSELRSIAVSQEMIINAVDRTAFHSFMISMDSCLRAWR